MALSFCIFALMGFVADASIRQIIVATGNFTLDGNIVNVAEYDVKSQTWTKSGMHEVFLYGDIYNGVVSDLVVNTTKQPNDVYVIGTFDTLSKMSSKQVCSVGVFDGDSLENIADGLCFKGGVTKPTPGLLTTGFDVKTGVLGSNGDIFVGGNFTTRLWGGALGYIFVYYVSRFDGASKNWLRLEGGQLNTTYNQVPSVNSLAWNNDDGILYIGGVFDSIDNRTISTGLALWTLEGGLVGLPTGGVADGNDKSKNCVVQSLAFEPKSKALFVSGTFNQVNYQHCSSIAVYLTASNIWKCLNEDSYYMNSISAMLLTDTKLYVSGYASSYSSWSGNSWNSPYAIARFDVTGFIDQYAVVADETRELTSIENSTNETAQELKSRFSFHMGSPSYLPTVKPSMDVPWSVDWEWLRNFTGGNGPVMSMNAGVEDFQSCIFIAGAFNNYAPTSIWCELTAGQNHGRIVSRELRRQLRRKGSNRRLTVSTGDAVVINLVGKHVIAGLITSVRQVFVLDTLSPTVAPTIGGTSSVDKTVLILSCSILVGIVLGIGCAFVGLFKQGSTMEVDNNNNKSHRHRYHGNDGHLGSGDDVVAGGISLKMFSDNQGGYVSIDFKECFERAMKARHLPAHDSLIMVNPKEIVLIDTIGEGSFGRVWSGHWRNNSVAVKEFVFAQAAIVGGSVQRNHIIEEIVGEAGVMSCLQHPKILQLYGCSLTMQALWIVSELCVRGSLRSVLVNRVLPLSLIKKLSICLDVADGMDYLHSRNPPIIHRDLKSHNIFITEPSPGHYIAKIGDWGSARAVQLSGVKSMTQGVGTACWLAPEVINNAHFSKHSDVYAFGIVLWEVYTRQEVYEGLSAAQIIAKVAHEELRPNVPRECPWAQVMTSCWNRNVNQRSDFKNILQALSKIHARLVPLPTLANAKSGEFKVQDLVEAGISPPRDHENSNSLYQDPTTNYSTRPPPGRFPNIQPYSAQTYASLVSPTERSRLLDYGATRYEFHPSLDGPGDFASNPLMTPHTTAEVVATPQSVPSFRSRPIDYATDPHNFRPPRPAPTPTTAVPAPPPVFYVASDSDEDDAQSESQSLFAKKSSI